MTEKPTTWDYRVVRSRSSTGQVEYALHEVHYENGALVAWTEEPTTFVGDTPEDVAADLTLALAATRRPVVDITQDRAMDFGYMSLPPIHDADTGERLP